MPDIAIEVTHTHGGIDKLDVYVGLEVPEVWFWADGKLAVYVLDGERYAPRERSQILPGLDLALLASFVPQKDQTDAVRRYRDALGAG